MANSYCDYTASGKAPQRQVEYHDNEYGFPISTDAEYFERLTLEVFQAGLSWDLVLVRRPLLIEAFDRFDVDKVAAWTEEQMETAVEAPGMIKNRLKIKSTVYNAQQLQKLSAEHGSFDAWVRAQPYDNLADWVKAMKAQFKFMGPEVVREFLTSTGLLDEAHDESCHVYARYRAARDGQVSRP